MLSARRKSDGQIVTAYTERKASGPFACVDCKEEVLLRTGKRKVNYFAHANYYLCKIQPTESDEHRRCKMEIYESFLRQQNVQNAALERALGEVRPDVSAYINGVPVAIEVQLSNLSLETITQRTIEYARKGIYVLWLLQWTPKLDQPRYSPRLWEKWIHACYFGRVYYWIEGLTITYYEFEPSFKTIPQSSWYSPKGEKMTGGGYSIRSKRYRTAVRGKTLNLAKDFAPKQRYWWEGNGIKVPDAKLFLMK